MLWHRGMRTTVILVVLCAWPALAFPRERLARLLGLSTVERPTAPLIVEAPPGRCHVIGTLRSRIEVLSVATVQCDAQTRDVWVGDRLDDGVIVAIGHAEVFVQRADRLERLGLRPRTPVAPVSPVSSPAPRPRGSDRVARAVVDAALRDPTELMQQVRLLPSFAGGRWLGLRAAWVKPDSTIAQLGLEKGDVLVSVNGKALDGLQASLEIVQALGGARSVQIELERQGARLTRTLRIE